jgi:hypothetical protein
MDYKADLTPEQKLDIVLQFVVNLSADQFIGRNDIAYLLSALAYEKEIGEILLKLYKDGYVATNNEIGTGYFFSNFDGRLFIDNGGYTAKALRDSEALAQQRLDAARLIDLESQNLTNSNLLNTLTGRLVRATWFAFFAAIGLLAWDVVKFLIEQAEKAK